MAIHYHSHLLNLESKKKKFNVIANIWVILRTIKSNISLKIF
jgi:hypothetical protein